MDKYGMSCYLRVVQSYYPRFGSNGCSVVFLSNLIGIPQVWRVDAPRASAEILWPDPMTFDNDGIKSLAASPAPGDNRLIFGRDSGGNENIQLYLLSPDTGAEVPLTEGFERSMHLLCEWSADGSEILFSANRRNPGLFDLHRQRIGEPARLVWENDAPGFVFDAHFSPDGRHAVIARESGSASGDLLEIDLSTGKARVLSPDSPRARYGPSAYAPDGLSLFVNTDLGSDYQRICRLQVDTLAIEPMVDRPWDVQMVGQSRDRRRLAYTVNVDGADELAILDLDSGKTIQPPSFGVGPGVIGMTFAAMLPGGVSFSPDGNRVAFGHTSGARTSDVMVWDVPAGVVRPVTRSSHSGLPLGELASPELVHYPTFDGRQIPAWIIRPTAGGDGPSPAVVWVHGGPAGQSRPSFVPFLQALAANGYAVFVPNVRGSTGYGKTYMTLDEGRLRMDSVADLAAGARWLREQPGIRGDRIAVVGPSYGGFMVLSGMTEYPDLWAAGIDIVGISNWVTFLENTSSYRRAHREEEYGTLENDREFLQQISPLTHVDRIAAPLLVIHGRNDPRVPLSEAEQVVAALRSRDVPCELIVFDDEGHGVSKLKNQLVAYPAMMEFLEKHLKG